MREEVTKEKIKDDILREARVLKIQIGTAEIIADKVSEKVFDWSKKRSIITVDDLNHQIAKEVAKFNKDLAYLFESRGKII